VPLNASQLATLIKTNIQAQFNITEEPILQQFCDAVAQAVVQHITASALVNTTGVVTSGAGAGGAVTSTGTVS
jgi:hypothetical protein